MKILRKHCDWGNWGNIEYNYAENLYLRNSYMSVYVGQNPVTCLLLYNKKPRLFMMFPAEEQLYFNRRAFR